MLNILLAVASEFADEYPKKISVGEAAIDALLGFLVVFIGIAFLVAIVWLVGFIMRRATVRKESGKTKAEESLKAPGQEAAVSSAAATENGEELSEETVAVIIAAIMAYYTKEKTKCEFTVKRIRRL